MAKYLSRSEDASIKTVSSFSAQLGPGLAPLCRPQPINRQRSNKTPGSLDHASPTRQLPKLDARQHSASGVSSRAAAVPQSNTAPRWKTSKTNSIFATTRVSIQTFTIGAQHLKYKLHAITRTRESG